MNKKKITLIVAILAGVLSLFGLSISDETKEKAVSTLEEVLIKEDK